MKTLDQWATERSLGDEAVAELIDCDRSYVSKLRRGQRRPSWSVMRRIVAATNGEVTPNDFLAAPESPDPESPDDDTPQLPPTHSAQPVEVAA